MLLPGKTRKDGPIAIVRMDIISPRCYVICPTILCPEYAVKMVTENEAQVYQAYIYLPPHLEGAQMIHEIAPTLREAFEAVALEALAELCERHSVQLEDALAAFLPIHYQADLPWRFQRLQMLEHQEHIAAHPARYGRDIMGAQLATTAEYALNVFNLQIR